MYQALKLGRVPLTTGRNGVWNLFNRLGNDMAEASLEHAENATVGWNGGARLVIPACTNVDYVFVDCLPRLSNAVWTTFTKTKSK